MPRVSVKCMKCCYSKMAARPNAFIIYSFQSFYFYLHVAHSLLTVVLLTMPSTCNSNVNVSLLNFNNKINILIMFLPCKGKIQGRDFRQIRSLLSICLSQVSHLTSAAKLRALEVLNRLTLLISKTFSALNRMFWFSCERKGFPFRAQSGSVFTVLRGGNGP